MSDKFRVRLRRHETDMPWGFRLQGGKDFATPFSVQKLSAGSLADRSGLRPGDHILSINGRDVQGLDHDEAKMEIIRGGNEVELVIMRPCRGNAPTELPKATPPSQLRTGPRQELPQSAPNFKVDLTVKQPDLVNIGSSHNRAPMPFSAGVGTTTVYQAQKPTNWRPPDYMNYVGEDPNQPGRVSADRLGSHISIQANTTTPGFSAAYSVPPPDEQSSGYRTFAAVQTPCQAPPPSQQYPSSQRPVNSPPDGQTGAERGTAVFHSPYNSPIGLYSSDNVLDAFKAQTAGRIEGLNFVDGDHRRPMHPPQHNSPTCQMIRQEDRAPPPSHFPPAWGRQAATSDVQSRSFSTLQFTLDDGDDV